MADPFRLQRQIQQNSTELRDFVNDLQSWEDDIAKKDQGLKDGTLKLSKNTKPPPVRGSVPVHDSKPKPLGKKPKKAAPTSSGPATPFEKKKTEGNTYFKKGLFTKAVDCYSECIKLDPNNAVGFSNRAAAHIKLKRFVEAEQDCTAALALDPRFVKAFLRRAASRKEQGKLQLAIKDIESILDIDANVAGAKKTLKAYKAQLAKQKQRAEKQLKASGKAAAVPAVVPNVQRRSLLIEEVDDSSSDEDDEQDVPFRSRPTRPTPTSTASQPSSSSTSSSAPGALLRPKQQSGRMHSGIQVLDTPASSSPSSAPPKANGRHPSTPERKTHSKPSHSSAASLTASPLSPAEQIAALRVPSTAVEYEAQYKACRGTPEVLSAYLQLLPPAALKEIMETGLDAEMLKDIVISAQQYFAKDDPAGCLAFLKALSAVPRFGMVVMFLDDTDAADIDSLFKVLAQQLPAMADELAAVKEAYSLD